MDGAAPLARQLNTIRRQCGGTKLWFSFQENFWSQIETLNFSWHIESIPLSLNDKG
jgi:hypothetical protein